MPPVAWMLSMLAQDADAAGAVERYRTLTRARVECRAAIDADEVVVCGLRDSDRFRVPLVEPATVDALGERHRLLKVPDVPCGVGRFLNNCGMAGVTASTRGGVRGMGQRPLAP